MKNIIGYFILLVMLAVFMVVLKSLASLIIGFVGIVLCSVLFVKSINSFTDSDEIEYRKHFKKLPSQIREENERARYNQAFDRSMQDKEFK